MKTALHTNYKIIPVRTISRIFLMPAFLLLLLSFLISNQASARTPVNPPGDGGTINLSCPEDRTEPACQSQEDIDAAFSNWIASAEFSSKCQGSIFNSSDGAPPACGGSRTVTFTVIDNCQNTETCEATFTVEAPPPVILNCPNAISYPPCESQAIVSSLFEDWLGSVSFSGGCNAAISNDNNGAPVACGGRVTVNFTVTSTCEEPVVCQSFFEIQAAPQLTFSCPQNQTVPACQTPGSLQQAFNAWLALATVNGGCNAVISNNNQGAPSICGGFTTVSFTVKSDCQPPSSCQATFTVANAPPVVINCPFNRTEAACQTQASINLKFSSWLNSFSFSGGCNSTLSTNNPNPPPACGGSTTVIFSVNSTCQSPVTCQATFTVNQSTTQNSTLTCPQPRTELPCQTQIAINSSYASWLASATFTGCASQLSNNSTGAPSACGGSKSVTFTLNTCQGTLTCQSTFTVPPSNTQLSFNCPVSKTETACQTQSAINTKFNAWLSTAVATGGCNLILTNNNTGAPSACGGTTNVTFSVSDICSSQTITCSASFTVAGVPAVLICPPNRIEGPCQSQANINVNYNTWLSIAAFSGGCNAFMTHNSTGAPNACGGTKVVTFTVVGNCGGQLTCSASFTVNAAPAVLLNCPPSISVGACQTQAAITAHFNLWLSGVSFSGGCNSTLSTSGAIAPSLCGGTSTVTFTVRSTCQPPVTCTSSFTVAPPPPVVLTCVVNRTEAACQSQAAINASYAAFLADPYFTGGCNATLLNNGVAAPYACGGTSTVIFTVTSACQAKVTCQSTFTVATAPPLILSCPLNRVEAACQTQAAINAKFAAWLATAGVTGGCNTTFTYSAGSAPSACGGSTTVTFSTNSTCQRPVFCASTFTVTPAPLPVLNCPANQVEAACQSQTVINAKYAAWLATAAFSGGCNGVLINNSTGAPSACGGTKTVTFTLVTSCGNTLTCQAKFKVNKAPAIALHCPSNLTAISCFPQSTINGSYALWLASASFTGGCQATMTNNSTGAPSSCGGTKTVKFTVTDICGSIVTCEAKYTVQPAAPLVLSCPINVTEAPCQTQASINAKFNAWMALAASSGGCNSVLSHNSVIAPSACGGTTTVNFTVSSTCGTDITCASTFTVRSSLPVVLNCPPNRLEFSCRSQAFINARYAAWLNSAVFSGDCNAVFSNNSTGAPSACGGTKTVTFTVASTCQPPVTCAATFTVLAPTPLVLNCPPNQTEGACQTQAVINAKYAAWLASVSFSGGCNPTLLNTNPSAPSACGGSVTVAFSLNDNCLGSKTCTATFTVKAPDPVVLNCPPNQTEASCQTQADINNKYNAWLASFSITGGCFLVSYHSNIAAPSSCGGTSNVLFTIVNNCPYQVLSCNASFTVEPPPPTAALICPPNVTESSCQTNSSLNAKYLAWLNSASGCGVITHNGGNNPPHLPGGGTRTVVFTDHCLGTTCVATFTVARQMTTVLSRINVQCYGGNTGFAQVNVSGGVPPYSYLWSPNGETTPGISNLIAGPYTVLITDAKGCTRMMGVNITQPPPMIVVFSSTGPVGGPYTDNASVSGGTPPYSFLWTPGGESTPSASGHVENVTYSVQVTDAHNCVSTFSITHESQGRRMNSGIETVENSPAVNIYPNPTSGKISIEFNANEKQHYRLEVMNLIGQRAYVGEGTSIEGINKIDYDFGDLIPGIYFIRLDIDDRSDVIKVVLEK